MNKDWPAIVLGILTLLSKPGLAIYFSESGNLTLSPQFWPENTTVHVFKAILDPDDSGYVLYSISAVSQRTNCPHLYIHQDFGSLSMLLPNRTVAVNGTKTKPTKAPGAGRRGRLEEAACSYKVMANLKGTVGMRKIETAEIKLNLIMTPPPSSGVGEECSKISPEVLCFQGLEVLELSAMENSASVSVANLGHFNHLCGEYYFNYSISIDELSVQQNTTDGTSSPFSILTQPSLDREQIPSYDFQLTCHLSQINGAETIETSIPGNLTVLDQNDSPIQTQNGTKFDIVYLSFTKNDNKFEAGCRLNPPDHKVLLLKDADTVEVNRYEMISLNDTKNLLEYEIKSSSFSVAAISNNSSSVIFIRIKLSKNVESTHPWQGNYCVAANITDVALVDEYPPMSYIICLGWGSVPHPFDQKTFDHKPQVFESAESQCDPGCVALYASGSLAITAFVVGFVFFIWKRKANNKRKSTQPVMVDPSDVELINGYGDHGGNRSFLPDSNYNGSGLNGFFGTNAHFSPDNFFQVESKWEIPREDLLLDHILVLGEGEFGRVLKGVMRSVTATGTVHVAVKMLKVDHGDGSKSVRQEFMAEFSLLKQLDHPNVIKLLGACTSNGGPPYLVMEYAEFGSLRSFLRKCRRVETINQNQSNTSSEGYEIGRTNLRSSAELQALDYIVTPQEVLGFSWQIAKGMAYLSDMKMVHRDLAGRNVLLTKSKMCKISDFGLTRDIYVDDAYKKKSKDRVPVKWLAPECLTDELYTSKSDVWAFGILLWELATLGASPYPGIQTEHLYSLLDSGYRMPQPANCSDEVYTIMMKCWGNIPLYRPTFHELVYELSRLLEDGIEYLKLDIPSVSNPGYDILNQESPA